MKSVRPSSLNQTRKCPGFAKLAKRVSTEHPGIFDNKYTKRGTDIHADLALYFSKGISNDDSPYAKEVEGFLDWFLSKGYWNEDYETVSVESKNTVIITGVDSDISISGTMDLFGVYITQDGAAIGQIFDWKTGAGRYLPPIGDDYQMRAYALLAENIARKANVYLSAIEVYRVQFDNRQVDSLDIGRSEFYDNLRMVTDLADIACGDGPLITGHHCTECLYKSHCDKFLDQSTALVAREWDGSALVSFRQAKKLAEAIPALKALLKKGEDEIKDFVRDSGPIISQGKEYGPRTHTRKSLPKMTEDQAADLGVEPIETKVESFRWRKIQK